MSRQILKQPVTGIRTIGMTPVADITGELTIDNRNAFLREVSLLLDENPVRLALDLSRVSHMDSSGLGALAQLQCRVRKNGTILCLVAPSPQASYLLRITGLDTIIPIFPTEAELALVESVSLRGELGQMRR